MKLFIILFQSLDEVDQVGEMKSSYGRGGGQTGSKHSLNLMGVLSVSVSEFNHAAIFLFT